MKRRRGYISLKTKLAAALGQMMHEVDGKLEPIFTHAELKELSEDQILSLFQWDHSVTPHAEDGEDVHWNLEPRLIVPHRIKTKTVDVPGIAKRKRVAKAEAEFRARILTPRDQRPPKKSRWGSRQFPKRKKANGKTCAR